MTSIISPLFLKSFNIYIAMWFYLCLSCNRFEKKNDLFSLQKNKKNIFDKLFNYIVVVCMYHCLQFEYEYNIQLLNQDYNLASHSTYVVCVYFLRTYIWRILQFRKIFKKLFMAILFSFSAFTTNLLRESHVLSYIHTYIIGHYNPSVRIFNLSHNLYCVC